MAPDLLLLDVHLPDMSGIDVLKRLRERGDDIDAIVVAAERDADFVKGALRGDAAQYLIKPFDLDELKTRIIRYARARLASGKTDQQAVDAVRGALAGGAELSATTCAEATGMARPTVRRHLEHLAERREANVRLKYGGGRPERPHQSMD